MEKLGHRPELDALRGVAILLVLFGHTRIPGFASGGTSGVTLFFVLSGFLITVLLREEQLATGTLSLRSFYRRRAVRLLPALAVFLTVMLLVGVQWQHVLAGALYVGNWVRALGGSLWPLSHLWSLAVEEQFYLAWPLILLAVPIRPGWLVVAALIGMVASLLAPEPLYAFASWTHAPSLALGASLGLAFTAGWGIRWPRISILVGSIALATVTLIPGQLLLAPAAIGSTLILAGLLQRPVLTWAPLRTAGRVSYAWYLWHFPVVLLLPFPFRWEGLISIPLSLALAAASWRYVERPFSRLRGHDQGGHVDLPQGLDPSFAIVDGTELWATDRHQ